MNIQDFHSSTYRAQCKTYAIAREMTGDFRNVTRMFEPGKCPAPFCLRILPAYRSAYAQEFRDSVAREVRARRKFSKGAAA